MQQYIATFYTHLAAIRTQRTLKGIGLEARLAPVPRKLSASCGTCVLYSAETPCLNQMDADVEKVVVIDQKDGGYVQLLHNA